MSLDFQEDFLIDLCEVITDGSHFSPPSQIEGYFMASVKDMGDYDFQFDDCRKISYEDYQKLLKSGCSPQNEDILIAKDGSPLSNIFIYNEKYPMVILSSIAIIRANQNKILPKFLKYYLENPLIKKYIQSSFTSGSVIPRIILKDFKKFEISYPSIENQIKIISILDNIDKKIEINQQINHNLLKLSKYLYKEFYLDKVELYIDKQYITLDEVTSKFATGLNPRKNFVLGEGNNYYVTIKNMANNSIVLDDKCASITDEALEKINNRSDLQVGDLLFSGIGTIGRVHLIDEEPTNWNISESVFTMRPNDLISSELLFIMLLSQEVQEYAKTLASGSVQKGIRMRDLKAYEFILLNEEDRLFLDSLLIPIISDIKANEKEIRYLTKLRDILLPKLMSGEIDVSEVNCDLKLIIRKFILKISTIWRINMKTKLISKIQNQMKPFLNQGQYLKLTNSLLNSLKDIEIIDNNNDSNEKDNFKLLKSFLSAKQVEGRSEKTLIYYNSTLEKMLLKINKQVYNITTDDIRRYLFDYKKEKNSSKITIDNMRRIFSSFFSWLEDEDYILKNPVRRIHRVKTGRVVKEVLTDENLEILRDNCDEIRDLAIVEILISTGIRVGELVRLNINDINFYERECVVFGKGESERVVYFDARTKIHLLEYLESRTDDNPALFVSLNQPNERLGISGVETRLRELGRKCKIPKVHPHKFRRTLATNAIDKGMPIEQVQKLLGHVQIDTTMQYAMVNQSNVKISHRKFIS